MTCFRLSSSDQARSAANSKASYPRCSTRRCSDSGRPSLARFCRSSLRNRYDRLSGVTASKTTTQATCRRLVGPRTLSRAFVWSSRSFALCLQRRRARVSSTPAPLHGAVRVLSAANAQRRLEKRLHRRSHVHEAKGRETPAPTPSWIASTSKALLQLFQLPALHGQQSGSATAQKQIVLGLLSQDDLNGSETNGSDRCAFCPVLDSM